MGMCFTCGLAWSSCDIWANWRIRTMYWGTRGYSLIWFSRRHFPEYGLLGLAV